MSKIMIFISKEPTWFLTGVTFPLAFQLTYRGILTCSKSDSSAIEVVLSSESSLSSKPVYISTNSLVSF